MLRIFTQVIEGATFFVQNHSFILNPSSDPKDEYQTQVEHHTASMRS